MRRVCAAVVWVSAMSLAGCTADWAKQNDSSIYFEIGRITGVSNTVTTGAGTGDVLYCDVSKVINEDAKVAVNIFQKNPNITASSPNNHVDLNSYRVRFFRTDGRNTEGVDVPYSITGPLARRIHTPSSGTEQEVEVVITVVRQQAKLESPLRNMVGGLILTFPQFGSAFQSGPGILTTIAEITIFGRTLTGSNVTATGRLQVTFADFTD